MFFFYMHLPLFIASCLSLSFFKPTEPLQKTPEIIAKIPHLAQSFTQGLLWHNGSLYESVGRYGQSEIRELSAKTGMLLRSIANNPNDFGEGLALANDILVQLSWREGYALRWSLADFSPVEPRWHFQRPGWGLSYMSDKKLFARSDGSATIHFHNADTFVEEATIEVQQAGQAVPMINELEYAKGRLFANIYGVGTPFQRILEIDPNNGKVIAEINLQSLCQLEQAISHERVLNGIAYNETEDVFYVTGKNWDNIYIIRF